MGWGLGHLVNHALPCGGHSLCLRWKTSHIQRLVTTPLPEKGSVETKMHVWEVDRGVPTQEAQGKARETEGTVNGL